jgi:hypothetical protein
MENISASVKLPLIKRMVDTETNGLGYLGIRQQLQSIHSVVAS